MILSFRLASLRLILALAAVVMLSVSAVKCGDTITNDTVLNEDIDCYCNHWDCEESGCHDWGYDCPVIVEGPATLDFNGHAVRGLWTTGQGATIKNGITMGEIRAEGALITNLFAIVSGMWPSETGLHLLNNCTLLNVTVNNSYVGIYVEGNNNRLVQVTAKDSQYGVYLRGNNNQMKDSYIARTDYDGIKVHGSENTVISNTVEDVGNCIDTSGVGNAFENNTFRRCGANGLFLEASTGSRITGNLITKSGGDSIALLSTQNAVVDSNIIVDSGGSGIVLDSLCGGCTIKCNTVSKCAGMGIRIRAADDNNVTDNKVSFCSAGIHAGLGSDRNRFLNNFASNNSRLDLNDLSPNCGTSVWKGNTGMGNIACTMTSGDTGNGNMACTVTSDHSGSEATTSDHSGSKALARSSRPLVTALLLLYLLYA